MMTKNEIRKAYENAAQELSNILIKDIARHGVETPARVMFIDVYKVYKKMRELFQNEM